MDFAPDGTLYGTTAPGAGTALRELISIDPVTGMGTYIGTTDDGAATNLTLQGSAFVAGVLYAFDATGGRYGFVNLTTGLVTIVGLVPGLAPGGGYAVNAANALGFYMTSDVGNLQSVNIATGTLTNGPALSGYSQFGGRLKSATFHAGTLYAVSAITPGAAGTNRQVVSINTATGVITAEGPALTSMLAGGMASRTR
jgi:hypothetical protein